MSCRLLARLSHISLTTADVFPFFYHPKNQANVFFWTWISYIINRKQQSVVEKGGRLHWLQVSGEEKRPDSTSKYDQGISLLRHLFYRSHFTTIKCHRHADSIIGTGRQGPNQDKDPNSLSGSMGVTISQGRSKRSPILTCVNVSLLRWPSDEDTSRLHVC